MPPVEQTVFDPPPSVPTFSDRVNELMQSSEGMRLAREGAYAEARSYFREKQRTVNQPDEVKAYGLMQAVVALEDPSVANTTSSLTEIRSLLGRLSLAQTGTENGYYRYYMGQSYEREADYSRALSYYLGALASFSGNTLAQTAIAVQIAQVYEYQGDWDGAYAAWKQAGVLAPEDPRVHAGIDRVMLFKK